MHMVFNFVANQRLFLSLVRQDAGPLAGALAELPAIPEAGQWASFVKNHDEPQPGQAQRRRTRGGVRRVRARGGHAHLRPRHPPPGPAHAGRRPPPARARLQPAVRPAGRPRPLYGEEPGWATTWRWRAAGVRVAMQWSDGDGCGFTSARPRAPVDRRRVRLRPGQRRRPAARPGSLLNWMERLVRTRKETPELGWGAPEVLSPATRPCWRCATTGGARWC